MKANIIRISFCCILLMPVMSSGQGEENSLERMAENPEKYYVKEGETLWSIAKKCYGEPLKWKLIWENNSYIKNPHEIYPGQMLLIGLDAEKTLKQSVPSLIQEKKPEPPTVEKVPELQERKIKELSKIEKTSDIIKEKKIDFLMEEPVVRVLFTNNSNGKLEDCNCPNDPFGGLAERTGLIRSYRDKNGDILLLDSGGYFGLSRVEHFGPLVLKLMEEMGYDACGISDQELYYGLEKYLVFFDWFSDNIINASIHKVNGDSVFALYRIFVVNGVRIGITGIVSSEGTFKFFPEERKDFTVEDPNVTLGRILPVLKKSSDYIIVISQMGVNMDKQVAEMWPDIDLIIGGHSQTLLKEAVNVSGCHIVQAGRNGGRVGEIILTFDKSKKVKNFSYNLLEVDDKYKIPEDIRLLMDKTLQ